MTACALGDNERLNLPVAEARAGETLERHKRQTCADCRREVGLRPDLTAQHGGAAELARDSFDNGNRHKQNVSGNMLMI